MSSTFENRSKIRFKLGRLIKPWEYIMIALLMSERDNVAVVTSDVKQGDIVKAGGKEYTAAGNIPAGHKIAVCDIGSGDDIIKYGKIIGKASDDIRQGEWVHCHNVADITAEISRRFAEKYRSGATDAH